MVEQKTEEDEKKEPAVAALRAPIIALPYCRIGRLRNKRSEFSAIRSRFFPSLGAPWLPLSPRMSQAPRAFFKRGAVQRLSAHPDVTRQATRPSPIANAQRTEQLRRRMVSLCRSNTAESHFFQVVSRSASAQHECLARLKDV